MNESLLITLKTICKEIPRCWEQWKAGWKHDAWIDLKLEINYNFYHWWLSKRTTSRFAKFFNALSREDLSGYTEPTPQEALASLESCIEGREWRNEMGF